MQLNKRFRFNGNRPRGLPVQASDFLQKCLFLVTRVQDSSGTKVFKGERKREGVTFPDFSLALGEMSFISYDPNCRKGKSGFQDLLWTKKKVERQAGRESSL